MTKVILNSDGHHFLRTVIDESLRRLKINSNDKKNSLPDRLLTLIDKCN